jgi:hypothetical protein
MAQVIIGRKSLGTVYAYDVAAGATEVNNTLRALVKEFKTSVNIWVISGTHGTAKGTVSIENREPDFKAEDLDTANRTSRQIHIKDYHLLAPNTWAELSNKPSPTNVLVLGWCFSKQWFENHGAGGNDGKLKP